MRFDIITLFPQLIEPYLVHGINRRAVAPAGQAGEGPVSVHFWNPRDYAQGEYRRVDDRPFGGGPGMVMQAEPLYQCLQAIRAARAEAPDQQAPVVYFSPIGQALTHSVASHWATQKPAGAILLCGRYEGVDERFLSRYVTAQISLGDFVLSGGEVAAAAFLDAVLRLLPGVLNDAQSHQQDSFNPALSGLLDCPQYTRPEMWQDESVPAVLLSGNHAHIAQWRREQSLRVTAQKRPELLKNAKLQGALDKKDRQFLEKNNIAL